MKSNSTNGSDVTLISEFDYFVNEIGQRENVARSGDAFTSANTETWSYNAKGEVVTANHSTNNAFDRSYEFDGIGNRKKSADSLTLPTTDNYQANALNQYGSIDGNTRSFDDDGNLTDDGTKQYVWDAENRLIAVKQGSNTIAEYAYDFRSRRITKTVGSNVTNFVYDGWNPIAVFSGTTLDKSYTWGKDLSGSMQGAGGVGGLLSVNEGSQAYYPVYDGNGNVSEYVDTTGAVVAHYEYDAFGQVVASGTKANDFSHQFSTKMLDSESGLNYYGYRFYDSSNGRWISRDPIGENGGENIYVFINNLGANAIDVFGLKVRHTGNPTKQNLKDFEQAMKDVANSSPEGKAMVCWANSPDTDLEVEWSDDEGPAGGNGADNVGEHKNPNEGGVRLNKDSDFAGEKSRNELKKHGEYPEQATPQQMRATVLGHELGHAAMNVYDPDVVSLVENPVRKGLGVEARKTYHGKDITPSEEESQSRKDFMEKHGKECPCQKEKK